MTATNTTSEPARAGLAPYPASREAVTLAEALDRLLYTGVSVEGRVAVGLADVELLFLDLRLLLGSVDTIWPDGRPPFRPMIPPDPAPPPVTPARPAQILAASPRSPPPPAPAPVPADADADVDVEAHGATAAQTQPDRDGSLARALGARPSPSSAGDGLTRLVLTLVKLLHDVLERQAVRRMSAGALTDTQIENVGAALLAQAVELERLRRQLGFSDSDLALDLGRRGGTL